MTKQEQFENAVKNNNISLVKKFLKDKDINPASKNNAAMRIISDKGHFDIAKLLIKDGRIALSHYEFCHSALETLSFRGHFDIIIISAR